MLLRQLTHADQNVFCQVEFDASNEWFRATWQGFVDTNEAMQGATAYLELLGEARSAYLLNDNTGIIGPWFDSLEWLEQVWSPQATRLGLRYLAHVVSPDSFATLPADVLHESFTQQFELQLFEDLAEAEQWLRTCQHYGPSSAPTPRLTA